MGRNPLKMAKPLLRLGVKMLSVGRKFLLAGWIGGILLGGIKETLGSEALGAEIRPSPTPVPMLAARGTPPLMCHISAPPCLTCGPPYAETQPPRYPLPHGYPTLPAYPPRQVVRPGDCNRAVNSRGVSPQIGQRGYSSAKEGDQSGSSRYEPGFPGSGYCPGLLTPLLMWFYLPGWCMPGEQVACFPARAGFPWKPVFPDRLCFPWLPRISSSDHHRGYYGDLYMWVVVPEY